MTRIERFIIHLKQKHYSKYYTKDLAHHCTSCYYRHRLCPYPVPDSKEIDGKIVWNNCEHWKPGGCYSCQMMLEDDDAWFENGCECECMGGCLKWKLREDFKK